MCSNAADPPATDSLAELAVVAQCILDTCVLSVNLDD